MKEHLFQEFLGIFEDSIFPLRVAIFYNSDEWSPYECLYSNIEDYRAEGNYGFYQLKPLIMMLAQKTQLISDEVLDSIDQENDEHYFCYLLDWGDWARKVMIFSFNDDVSFDHDKFVQIIKTERDELQAIFRKLFHMHRQKIKGSRKERGTTSHTNIP